MIHGTFRYKKQQLSKQEVYQELLQYKRIGWKSAALILNNITNCIALDLYGIGPRSGKLFDIDGNVFIYWDLTGSEAALYDCLVADPENLNDREFETPLLDNIHTMFGLAYGSPFSRQIHRPMLQEINPYPTETKGIIGIGF